jgi:hypothetical protein
MMRNSAHIICCDQSYQIARMNHRQRLAGASLKFAEGVFQHLVGIHSLEIRLHDLHHRIRRMFGQRYKQVCAGEDTHYMVSVYNREIML